MSSSESEKEDKEVKDVKEETDKKEEEKKEPEKKKDRRGKAMMKKGVTALRNSGDFFGRLGTLLVMLVSTTNTVTIMVTSFIEEVYWRGAIHAALLLFVHIPVLVIMIWLMCKARLMAIYQKVRPARGKTPAQEVTEEVTEEVDKARLEDTKKEQLKKLNQLKKEKDEKLEKRVWDYGRRGQHINRAFEMA